MSMIRSKRGKGKKGKSKRLSVRELRKEMKGLTKMVGRQTKLIEKLSKRK